MLHLSFIAARNRETGKVELLEFAGHVSAGGDRSAVGALHETLRSPEGADLRDQYSDVTVVIDNQVVAGYEFKDRASREREKKIKQLTTLRTQLTQAAARENAAAQAVEEGKAAKGERKDLQAQIAELEGELGIERGTSPTVVSSEQPPPVSPDAPPLKKNPPLVTHGQKPVPVAPAVTAGEIESSELSQLTVPDLKAKCEELGIDCTGFRVKAEYIGAILTDEKLSELTIPQLAEQAKAARISTTGFRRKRDYLDALEKRERDRADLEKLDAEQLARVAAKFELPSEGVAREEVIAAILVASSQPQPD